MLEIVLEILKEGENNPTVRIIGHILAYPETGDQGRSDGDNGQAGEKNQNAQDNDVGHTTEEAHDKTVQIYGIHRTMPPF